MFGNIIHSIALIAICLSPTTSNAVSAHEHGETTQSLLTKYREAIEDICVENAKSSDSKVREQLLQQRRNQFLKDMQSASVPEKTIAQHFDDLIDNLASANAAFRFKNGDAYRDCWIEDAAKAFAKEAESASDLKRTRTSSGWFEDFAGMMQSLRDKLSMHPGLGPQIVTIVSPVFWAVYKASQIKDSGDAARDYKDQVALIKKLFPMTKREFQAKNSAYAQVLDVFANTIFKERTR